MANKAELYEVIKKRFGTSDEDLNDLEMVMDALNGLDRLDDLETQLETEKLNSEKALKDLDDSWRTRYRERFFNGESEIDNLLESVNDEPEPAADEMTLDEYLEELEKGGK